MVTATRVAINASALTILKVIHIVVWFPLPQFLSRTIFYIILFFFLSIFYKIGIVLVFNFNPGSKPLLVDCISLRVSTAQLLSTLVLNTVWIVKTNKTCVIQFLSHTINIVLIFPSSVISRTTLDAILYPRSNFQGNKCCDTIHLISDL
jgi:hypothetical protein